MSSPALLLLLFMLWTRWHASKECFFKDCLMLIVPTKMKYMASMKGFLFFCFLLCRESCLINFYQTNTCLGIIQEGTDQHETRYLSVILFKTLSLSKLAKQSWDCLLNEQQDESSAAIWYCCWDFLSINSSLTHFLENDTEW